jgi:hypothetical protein
MNLRDFKLEKKKSKFQRELEMDEENFNEEIRD